ncbi:winged helix-turn-helix domain-containing protein [Streptomyces sp. RS10V-4]|uniref:AfsR/SARP family transcriptional regulator n=1 Tax=Streptomyces rhizoryzae TaxID=2932493 RepID=UPI00200392B4|nr:BTAD domain-containing putative transcriptional regulator [Streptomyces rhizoryzae]MCK7624220.1 winged helix-turn-helix domain-containing protein [Streptomyces rhizoryzae]
MPASLTATLLGPVLAIREGRQLELGSPTQRTIFAVLAAHANRIVSRDELVQAIWGDNAPPTAVNSVYTYVSRLRNSLRPEHRADHAELLVSDRSGYMLRVAPEGVDIQQFATALTTARQLRAEGAAPRAVRELEAGLGLWRGTPYGGAIGPFVHTERARLAEARLLALEDCAEMLLDLGRPVALVGELSALVHHHPLRERLRYLLMRCYVDLGWHADAVREYHSLRERLVEEQGMEPGSHLQQLYEQVLRGEPAPASAPRPARRPGPAAPAGSGGRPEALAQLVRDVPGFTGRTAELAQLTALAEESAAEPTLLLVTGGPGVGKTALATRFAHAMAHRYPDGQLHVDLRASGTPEQQAPEAAIRHLVAAMGQPPPPESIDARAAYRSLVADRRLLIVLDNAAGAEQVRALLPGTPSCLVVVTSRNGLAGLIARDGARRIVLDGMAEEDGLRLFGRIAGEPFTARHRPSVRRLVAACDGLPLALRIAATRIKVAPSPEDALACFENGDPVDFLELPGDRESSLRTVIGWSYDALPPEAAHVFMALGLQEARVVTLPLATGLSGMDRPECRRALHALADAGLLREVAPDHFRLDALILAYAQWLGKPQSLVPRQRSAPCARLATITTIAPSTDSERLQMTS